MITCYITLHYIMLCTRNHKHDFPLKIPLTIYWKLPVTKHWTSDRPLVSTTGKWSSVGKCHCKSIGPCMISEVLISGVRSFAPRHIHPRHHRADDHPVRRVQRAHLLVTPEGGERGRRRAWGGPPIQRFERRGDRRLPWRGRASELRRPHRRSARRVQSAIGTCWQLARALR